MPKYSYKCIQCDNIITIYHSFKEKKTHCDICESPDSLKRLPSRFTLYKEKKTNKVGSLVNQSISEFKDELEQEKQKLKNEFFEPDK